MHLEEPVVGDLAQPEAKGHRALLQIIAQPPDCLQLRLLDHVRRINARPQLRVEAKLQGRAGDRRLPNADRRCRASLFTSFAKSEW